MTDDDARTPAARGDDDLRAAVRALISREETRDTAIRALAETVSRLAAPPVPDGQAGFSWMDAAGTHRDLWAHLLRLADWLHRIYLRYEDAAAAFPECWLWHPSVIEELTWLMDVWRAAYSDDAPIHARADWHDRLRPRVVTRVRQYTTGCALEAHRQPVEVPAPTVRDAEAIALWWATPTIPLAPIPSQLTERTRP